MPLRLDELRHSVAEGARWVKGEVEVDQVYAHYQHERPELKHPRGGEAFFLLRPLMENYALYMGRIARSALQPGGVIKGMRDSMEDLSDQVELRAPKEFGDLMRSGHPRVKADSRTVYDRQPKQHRLTEHELRIKARMRHLPPEIIGYIWWHVMHHTQPPPHLHRRRG